MPEDSFPISHIQLVNKSTFSDMSFITSNGTKIPAHSCIIIARCPSLVNPSNVPFIGNAGNE